MQNLKKFLTGSVVARLIASALLFVALTRQQIGYYSFLRWVTLLTAIYALYVSYNKAKQINFGVWLFGIIAILFNPLIPFYFGKSTWQNIDIITGIIFIASIFLIKEDNLNVMTNKVQENIVIVPTQKDEKFKQNTEDDEKPEKTKKLIPSSSDKTGTKLDELDSKILKSFTVIGQYHFERGAQTFREFSKRMIDDVGDKVEPYINDLWEYTKSKNT